MSRKKSFIGVYTLEGSRKEGDNGDKEDEEGSLKEEKVAEGARGASMFWDKQTALFDMILVGDTSLNFNLSPSTTQFLFS